MKLVVALTCSLLLSVPVVHCGDLKFTDNDYNVATVTFRKGVLTVPQHCRADTCTAQDERLRKLEAKNDALQAVNVAQADENGALRSLIAALRADLTALATKVGEHAAASTRADSAFAAADARLEDALEAVAKMQGPQGPRGAKGDQGMRGLTGAKGERGTDGAAGVDGRDGNDGATGTKGATGATGPTGKDGKDGQDGRDGAKGAKGDKGDAGGPPQPQIVGCTNGRRVFEPFASAGSIDTWTKTSGSSLTQTTSNGKMTVTDANLKGEQGWIYDADCAAAHTATNTFRKAVSIGAGDFDIQQRIDWRSSSAGDVFSGYIAVSDAAGDIIALAGPADPSSGFGGVKRATITDGTCSNYAGDLDTYGKYSQFLSTLPLDGNFRNSDNTYRIQRIGGVLKVSVDGNVVFSRHDTRAVKYINILANRHHTSRVYGFGTLIFHPISLCFTGMLA